MKIVILFIFVLSLCSCQQKESSNSKILIIHSASEMKIISEAAAKNVEQFLQNEQLKHALENIERAAKVGLKFTSYDGPCDLAIYKELEKHGYKIIGVRTNGHSTGDCLINW